MTGPATIDTGPERHGASPPPAARSAPAVVYLLADHLDAVLARGEDLLATSWRPQKLARCAATIAAHQDGQRRTVDAVRTLELSLLARALKARERAIELSARDHRFAAVAHLFAAFTGQLEDAAIEAGDATLEDFETGDGILAYLRGRGLVAADTATFDDCGTIVVTPAFRIARRIELGPLLDLVATFLDTLEIHFELYPVLAVVEMEASSPSLAETADAPVVSDAIPPEDATLGETSFAAEAVAETGPPEMTVGLRSEAVGEAPAEVTAVPQTLPDPAPPAQRLVERIEAAVQEDTPPLHC